MFMVYGVWKEEDGDWGIRVYDIYVCIYIYVCV